MNDLNRRRMRAGSVRLVYQVVMLDDRGFAHDVASAVLARMAADGGPPWTVLDATPSDLVHVRITVGSGPGAPDVVAAYFTAGVPRADAVVATADQLQDHAIEATGGAALPACPGHAHPLSAGVLDGVAQWICPQDPTHHRERILPACTR